MTAKKKTAAKKTTTPAIQPATPRRKKAAGKKPDPVQRKKPAPKQTPRDVVEIKRQVCPCGRNLDNPVKDNHPRNDFILHHCNMCGIDFKVPREKSKGADTTPQPAPADTTATAGAADTEPEGGSK